MQDTIIKGSGNSRSMKTVPNAPIIYPDFATFIQEFASTGIPFDMGPINLSGVTQKGTDLNKANLLSDETAAAYGLDNTAVPDDTFFETGKIGDLVRSARSEVIDALFTRYMPASGQILKASDYPKLAEAIGPMPVGYKVTRVRSFSDEPNLPKYTKYLIQGENGRLIFYSISTGSSGSVYQILCSDDNMETFRVLTTVEKSILGIFQSVSAPNKIFAITQEKTYTTTDNGETWTATTNNITIPSSGWYRQAQTGTVMCVSNSYIYRSNDDGITWEKINTNAHININDGTILKNGNIIIWSRSGSSPNYTNYFLLSKDAGVTWEYIISENGIPMGSNSNPAIFEFEKEGIVSILTKNATYLLSDYGETLIGEITLDFSGNTNFSALTGARSIFLYGYVSNDYGLSWAPSELGFSSYNSFALLPDGKMIATSSYGWHYSEADATTVFVPDVDGFLIKYQ